MRSSSEEQDCDCPSMRKMRGIGGSFWTPKREEQLRELPAQCLALTRIGSPRPNASHCVPCALAAVMKHTADQADPRSVLLRAIRGCPSSAGARDALAMTQRTPLARFDPVQHPTSGASEQTTLRASLGH